MSPSATRSRLLLSRFLAISICRQASVTMARLFIRSSRLFSPIRTASSIDRSTRSMPTKSLRTPIWIAVSDCTACTRSMRATLIASRTAFRSPIACSRRMILASGSATASAFSASASASSTSLTCCRRASAIRSRNSSTLANCRSSRPTCERTRWRSSSVSKSSSRSESEPRSVSMSSATNATTSSSMRSFSAASPSMTPFRSSGSGSSSSSAAYSATNAISSCSSVTSSTAMNWNGSSSSSSIASGRSVGSPMRNL